MPELPEVEGFKKYFEETALHQQVKAIEILDTKILTPDPDDFQKKLSQQHFQAAERLGKYLLVDLDQSGVLVIHFGMSGHLEHFTERKQAPRFSRLIFHLGNGYLAFVCPRKFGRIDWTESSEAFRKAKKLSTDARQMTYEEFYQNLYRRKAPIKSVLLDQKACAGVGNWIADEMLFQARIHPEERAHQLSDNQLEKLFEVMKSILELAISKEADYDLYPPIFMIHRRGWTAIPPDPCERTDCELETLHFKVGGRATYICAQCQILNESDS